MLQRYTNNPIPQKFFQFCFDFFDGGERGAEVIRKSLSEFIVGHAYRFGYVSQRILCFDAVFCSAQQQANGFVVALAAKNIIDSRAVEIQLADIFWLELRVLQFNHHIAMEEGIVHQHVDIIVVARHLDMVLPTHESKSCPHLDEEFLDVFCQSNLNVTFVVLVGESQHIKNIRVFEHGLHVIRFDCGKCCVKIVGKRTMLVVVFFEKSM